MKILHFINQFFAGIGGEESATVGLEVRDGAVGPGRLIATAHPDSEIVTIVGGDNYAVQNLDEVVHRVSEVISSRGIDVVVCGPAFNAGRYGIVCATLAAELPAKAGVPAITGLYEENAAVSLFSSRALMVRTGQSAAGMADAMRRIVDVLPTLAAGGEIEDRQAAGLFERHVRKVRLTEASAADRAVNMLLSALSGADDVGTELAVPTTDSISAPVPVKTVANAKIALVTEGGLVPRGNPDQLSTGRSLKWAAYETDELLSTPKKFESIHGGYDTEYVNLEPYRLVPADVVRDLVSEGKVGSLHSKFYTTSGMATPVEYARKMGSEIAEQLRNDGTQAVILTGT